ncbi:translin associated factor X interacting protein 1 [Rhinolophus ferrumequinum]|uniref:Translin associated factor X interacting protein 1 n=1 Tax=Rhinolophus ferrumequinum TaxID=59479 RepID=A0A7J7SLH7_RHIFE|nr:translin associated factor X interacting protein 1 [Rhinolophus ferrumequinum]
MASPKLRCCRFATTSRTHPRPSVVTIDDPFITETNDTKKCKLYQKRKRLVSGDVLLELQMSAPDPICFLSATQSITHLKHAPLNGFPCQESVARSTSLWGGNGPTCYTSSEKPSQIP